NTDLRAYFQQLMRLRRSSPALSHGGFQLLHAEGNTLAFLREAPEERLLIVARRASDKLDALAVRAAALPDGTQLREVFTGTESVVSNGMLSLAGLLEVGARIWRVG
ncbi:MAG TPA: alpha-glucosidase C-terminal domain-containing protein, partial [Ktedonobacteraceae bacterium]